MVPGRELSLGRVIRRAADVAEFVARARVRVRACSELLEAVERLRCDMIVVGIFGRYGARRQAGLPVHL